MTQSRRFIQCDVFSSVATRGNALAVVLDGDGLNTEQMQQFAAWTNLAETTFLLPPTHSEADYRLRIFTPQREMRFAGHPTLGSCAAWLHNGGIPRESHTVRQECDVGIVEIDMTGEVPAFIAPPTTIAPMDEAESTHMLGALGINPSDVLASALLDNGPEWRAFELVSAQVVLDAQAQNVSWPDVFAIGLIGPHAPGSHADYEVRMLAPSSGMIEDPITGSLNAALAHWMLDRGTLTRNVVVAQGTCIGRKGRVFIAPDPTVPGRVRIGGHTSILIEGEVRL